MGQKGNGTRTCYLEQATVISFYYDFLPDRRSSIFGGLGRPWAAGKPSKKVGVDHPPPPLPIYFEVFPAVRGRPSPEKSTTPGRAKTHILKTHDFQCQFTTAKSLNFPIESPLPSHSTSPLSPHCQFHELILSPHCQVTQLPMPPVHYLGARHRRLQHRQGRLRRLVS